jgi:hypothetical protein
MSGFFEAVKNLFPSGRAFGMFADSGKRRLLEGLSALPDDVRREAEKVYFDLFPETMRFPDMWEKIFSLYLTEAEYEKRRDILGALWKTISGDQGANFLEQVLRAIHPDFHVVENTPLTDPRNRQAVELAICDYSTMVCDNEYACCDYHIGNDFFTPSILQNGKSDVYAVPDDERFWETCFFVCRGVERNDEHQILYIEPLEIHTACKNMVEFLILKTKPLHTTAVVFVKWLGEA